MSKPAIAALVLAGGTGTRAGGRDKGLLDWHGRPLIEHALDRLARAGIAEIVISANRNLEHYACYGHPVVADVVSGFRGPLAGIAAGLAAARSPRVLTVPVDAPTWPESLAERLDAALALSRALCAVARDGESRQSLFALYARSCAAAADEALARGDLSVWRFQDRLGAVEVHFDASDGAFANMNTSVADA